MKKFLAIYTGAPASMERWNAMPEGQRKEREAAGMKAWSEWASAHATAIVEQGAPLGKTKRASRDGVHDIKNAMAAFTIVQADSHEAAARLFENHPHFTIFPGDAVEVMEVLPMPTM
jgi:hypothetical protein